MGINPRRGGETDFSLTGSYLLWHIERANMNYGQQISSPVSVLETHFPLPWVMFAAQATVPCCLMKTQYRAPIPVQIEGEECYQIPLTKGAFAIINKEDLPKVAGKLWRYDNGWYATSEEGSPRRKIFMHRLILGTPEHLETDHINHNGLDNRRKNLRLATRLQNGANRVKPKGTSSKYKGVSYSKEKRKWTCHICLNQKPMFLGGYKSELAAALAYDKAAKEKFGEFAEVNFK